MRRTAGDRDKAIELLKTTTLKYKEISDRTGVPLGTINGMALVHRSAEVREANRRKAGTENLLAIHEKREAESGDTRTQPEEEKEKVQSVSITAPTPSAPQGLSRNIVFSYEAQTHSPITKMEALTEFEDVQKMIDSATGEQFTFSIHIQVKEGAQS